MQQLPISCEFCKTTVTPLWRRGPNGKATLCNACGVRWMRQQSSIIRADKDHDKSAVKREIIDATGSGVESEDQAVEHDDVAEEQPATSPDDVSGPRKARSKHFIRYGDDEAVVDEAHASRYSPVRRKIKIQRIEPRVPGPVDVADKMIVEFEIIATLERNLSALRSREIKPKAVDIEQMHEKRNEMKKKEITLSSQLLTLHRLCQDKIKRASDALRSSRARVSELEQKIDEIRTKYHIDIPTEEPQNVLEFADIRGDAAINRSSRPHSKVNTPRASTLDADLYADRPISRKELYIKPTDLSKAAAAVVASSRSSKLLSHAVTLL